MLTRDLARAVLVILLLVAAACTSGSGDSASEPDAPPTSATLPASAQEAILEALLADAIADAGAPGGVAGVWGPDGFAWVKGAGVAEVDTGSALEADAFFRIGSITAAFTCTLLVQLADEGAVDLDDPVGAYLDFVPNDEATLGQLCQHTSGIPDFTDTPELVDELATNPTRIWSPGEVFSSAFGRSPAFAPGEGWQFSWTNLWLVGEIVQQVAGRSIGAELADRILEPLGLADTTYPPPERVTLPDPHPDGFWSPDPVAPAEQITELSPSWAGPAGALVSTLSDLRAFAEALATGGLVGEAAGSHLGQPVPVAPDGPAWLGYGIGAVVVGPLVGHHGEIPGFVSAVLHDPETATTVVVMLNNSSGGSEVALGLAASMAAVVVPDRVPFTSEEATVAFDEIDLGGF